MQLFVNEQCALLPYGILLRAYAHCRLWADAEVDGSFQDRLMNDRPFRFGIVAGQAADMKSWTNLARHVENLGYDTLLGTDPLADMDPLTVLSAAAAVTTTLHVGTFVAVDKFRDRR